ncbi:MAG: hypothetical protein A2113_02190 [Candidatus Woykebacteria bacterium GWA1_44_8]|uniref:Uncharacterized protein n=1 Tax=Candidatus Woykebacteria bacterium GWA1_44_8 TaxID=1802591 RepID=A0A1G1W4U3_9BACT|nr:MAG: hypothetical protein A2113_02190 [Candidatus Woykebacteria bacterium GWA1_44_8]
MPENSEQKKINWKNVLVGVAIGVILIWLGVLIWFLLQLKPDEFTPITTSKASTPSAKKDETAKETTKATTPCASTLTEADKIEIKLWKTYENSKYNYSFKYPETWQGNLGPVNDKVVLNDNEALITFYFYSGIPTGFEGFTFDTKKSVEVACEQTEKVYFKGLPPGGENFRIIYTGFTKNGTDHVVWINYRYVGASISSDIVEDYDLILKTIEFK